MTNRKRGSIILTRETNPNQVICKSCGHKWLVSKKILSRGLDCLACGAVWHYVRHETAVTAYQLRYKGRWDSPMEREITIMEKARDETPEV